MKRFLIWLALFFVLFICEAKDVLTVDQNTLNITPKYSRLQIPLYPVFCFTIPEGYTDFELKASVTNFKGNTSNPLQLSDFPSDHIGNEVVWYYNSLFPYLSGSNNRGRAPYQKFNINFTKVYFQLTDAIKITATLNRTDNGTWDSRRYLIQTISTLNNLTSINYSLSSYRKSSSNIISGVMIVCGFDIINDKELAAHIRPDNINLMWTISFTNPAQVEHDSSGKQIWRPIIPTTWISDYNSRIVNINDLTQ